MRSLTETSTMIRKTVCMRGTAVESPSLHLRLTRRHYHSSRESHGGANIITRISPSRRTTVRISGYQDDVQAAPSNWRSHDMRLACIFASLGDHGSIPKHDAEACDFRLNHLDPPRCPKTGSLLLQAQGGLHSTAGPPVPLLLVPIDTHWRDGVRASAHCRETTEGALRCRLSFQVLLPEPHPSSPGAGPRPPGRASLESLTRWTRPAAGQGACSPLPLCCKDASCLPSTTVPSIC